MNRNRKRIAALLFIAAMPGCSLPAPAQDSQNQLWKAFMQQQQQAMQQQKANDTRGATESFIAALKTAHELNQNDPRLKFYLKTIEQSMYALDYKLRNTNDAALRERLLKAQLPVVEQVYGKNSSNYTMAVSRLMGVLAKQGKSGEVKDMMGQLPQDQPSGPAPAAAPKPIGIPNARPSKR